MTTTLEQWQAGKSIEGVPPWDGTGIPLPVGADGWPVPPDGELPAEIRVAPGATVNVPHDDPDVAAEPVTAWGPGEFATFTDGDFAWDGTAWVAYVAADPNLGWTKAELIQFAADHDPVIDVPTSGTKAEILAAILAYIESHPEEN